MSNSRKTVYLVTQSYCAFPQRDRERERGRGEREIERKRERNAVLSVVVNRTFEKIASKKNTEQRDKQRGDGRG